MVSFGKGQLQTEFPKANKDEIGTLNGSFRDMAIEIRKLIDGLNQRISEKEIAEKAELFECSWHKSQHFHWPK